MSDETTEDSITASTGAPYTIDIIHAAREHFEYTERMRLNQTDLLNAAITNNLTIYAGGTLEFFMVVVDEPSSSSNYQNGNNGHNQRMRSDTAIHLIV